MSVEVREDLMAVGSWRATLNNTPVMLDKLTVKVGEKRVPRKLTWCLYDSLGALTYVGVLLSVTPGEKGIEIGGQGMLWHLGSNDIGPKVDDREYVAGTDKLDNGDFDLDGLYWRTPSQGSLWVLSVGFAENVGGLAKDDVLEIDRKFPTRPGYAYKGRIDGVTGTGRMRLRTIYEGRFDPANLLVNGNFELGINTWTQTSNIVIVYKEGQRDGDYALRISPIPKPQLAPADFSTGWTLGATMSQVGGQLLIEETPKPQYIPHAGAGDFTVSPYVTYTNADPTKAVGASGYYRKLGPIGQHQVVINGGFESGLTGWTQFAGAWSTSSATFIEGANSATTGGVGMAMKNLQATVPLAVEVDEEWTLQGYVCSGTVGTADEADGEANFQFYVIDQAYPLYDSWIDIVSLKDGDSNKDQWHFGQQKFTAQPDKTHLVPMLTVYGQPNGSWYLDGVKMIRTRGNNTGIYSADFPAVPNQRYTFSTLFVVSDPRIAGSMSLRLIFKGPGVPDVETSTNLSQTYGQWRSLSVEGTCPKGYDEMVAAIDGDDILGGSFYIDADYTLLQKADNNLDRATGPAIPIVPDQRYLVGTTITPLAFIEKGTVRVGVTVSGAGLDDITQSVEHTFNEDDENQASRVTVEIRADTGYDTVTPFVLVKDLAGGEGGDIVAVSNFTIHKSDNNTDASVGATFPVIPERSYRWTQDVFSEVGLLRGNVRLSARCIRAGYPDITFLSQPIDATAAIWETIDFTFTPPSGYNTVSPSIIGTDTEGGYFYADNGRLVDADTGTYVVDATLDSPVNGFVEVTSTAPAGSETVRVAVVVEQGATRWTVDGASFKRTGVTPATGNAIVADVLKDPNTGAPLSIAAGTLSAPAVIPHDWWVLKRTNRQILDHLCNVIYEPPLEYHVNPALPPTLSVGPRATVFADLTDYILLLSDRQVIDIPPAESNVELRPTEIELIGAERQRLSGRPETITTTAKVPGPIEYDFNNRPIVRTETVADTTVDHQAYADAYAADLAAKRAEPPLQVTIRLSGTSLTPCKVGDTIYPYYPAAGLEDLSNPRTVEGQTVFPRGVRILSRLSRKGPAHTCTMRNPDGTSFPLSPLWSNEDSTELTVGDRVEDWSADPGGHATSIQFMRDWRSRPR